MRAALERVAGIEPASSAWKAAALPLSYTRRAIACTSQRLVKWWRGLDSNQRTLSRPDLQSGAFNHSTTPPKKNRCGGTASHDGKDVR